MWITRNNMIYFSGIEQKKPLHARYLMPDWDKMYEQYQELKELIDD